MPRNQTLVLALLTLALAIVILGIFVNAGWYSTIFDENGIIEMLTAVTYGMSALVALFGAVKRYMKTGFDKIVIGFLAFFAFALFLVAEEISIWVIFMDSEPPRVLGIKMDAAHDILHLGLKAIKSLIAYSMPLGLSVVASLGLASLALVYRFRNAIANGIKAVLSTSIGTYILVCVAFGCAALVADLRSETIPILKSVEEGLELSASLSLLLASYFAISYAFDDRHPDKLD